MLTAKEEDPGGTAPTGVLDHSADGSTNTQSSGVKQLRSRALQGAALQVAPRFGSGPTQFENTSDISLRMAFDEAWPVAEQRLLGWLIYCHDLDAARTAAATLEADDFCDGLHRQVFRAIIAELDAGRPPSVANLNLALAESPAFHDLNRPDYLRGLAQAAPALSSGLAMASLVREFQMRNCGAIEFAALANDFLRPKVSFEESEARVHDYLHYASDRLRDQAAKNDAFIFDGDAVLEPPDMLVEGLLPKKGAVFIGGQSGVGKTFIEIDLAHSLATGTPFFGHKVKQPVGVAIVAAEGAAHIPLRIAAVRQDKSPELGTLPIAWIPNAPPMDSSVDIEAFAKRLREVDIVFQKRFGIPLGAVSFDTLAATFDLDDENDNSEASRTMQKAKELGRAAGVLVVLVHHYGKSAATGLRGASGWRAPADVVLGVLGERNELTGEIKGRSIVLSKAREGEEGPIGGFALRKVTVGIAADGVPFGSCVVDAVEQTGKAASPLKSDRHKNALKALVEITLREGQPVPASFGLPPSVMAVTVDACREELHARGIIPEDDANPSATWARIKESLKAKGRAAERDGLIWPV